MKGYIPVDLPTKKYIKAYLYSYFNNRPYINRDTRIGSKLVDLLEHQTNEEKNDFSTRYNTNIRLYISGHLFRQRGVFLNHTNIKNFNLYVEAVIKERFYELMDDACEVFASFEANIDGVRLKLGIDDEAWSTDSMRKDYYRYRKEKGKGLFYKKNVTGFVPSKPLHLYAF